MSKSKKTRYTAAEKTKILKRHLVENEPLSQLCEEFNITATTFYNWQKLLFEKAPDILESKRPGRSPLKKKDDQIKQLEEQLSHKDKVLYEAIDALILAKKPSGENSTNRG